MRIEMNCRSKPYADQIFTLISEGSDLRIIDPSGNAVLQGVIADIAPLLRFPSFSDSIKHFAILVEQRILEFDLTSNEVKSIRDLVDRALAAHDPAFVSKLRKKAMTAVVIGIIAIVAGPAASIMSYLQASQGVGSGRYFIYYGLPIFGLAMLAKGLGRYFRVRALQRSSGN